MKDKECTAKRNRDEHRGRGSLQIDWKTKKVISNLKHRYE